MKKFINLYIRFVQKILISVLLTLVYFTFFSITKLIIIIFQNKRFKKDKKTESYWINAEGYTIDMDSALEQS